MYSEFQAFLKTHAVLVIWYVCGELNVCLLFEGLLRTQMGFIFILFFFICVSVLFSFIFYVSYCSDNTIAKKSESFHQKRQSKLPRPIPRNSLESDHGCTSRIYSDNASDNVALTLYNVPLTSQKRKLTQ